MKEVEQEVKTFFVNMTCDCGKGFLMFMGRFQPGIGKGDTLYSHKCSNCGKHVDLKTKYPLQKYASIGDKIE